MADYHRLGRGAKIAYALRELRDDPVECPACQSQVIPRDLETHAQRCPGRQWGADPGAAGWLTLAEVRELGVPWGSLQWWVRHHGLRRRERDGLWVYSRCDLLSALDRTAQRLAVRRSRAARVAALVRWRGR